MTGHRLCGWKNIELRDTEITRLRAELTHEKGLREQAEAICVVLRAHREEYAAQVIEGHAEIANITADNKRLRAELGGVFESLARATNREIAAGTAIATLRAELAECKRDAERWRAHHARKQAVIDAGMARNPMRAVAANMCPHCYAIVGAPHEAWCRSTQINAALAADGDTK